VAAGSLASKKKKKKKRSGSILNTEESNVDYLSMDSDCSTAGVGNRRVKDDKNGYLYHENILDKTQYKAQVKMLIGDYNTMGAFQHLFDGYDEIYLTKLDLIYDSQVYERELFGTSSGDSFQNIGLATGLLSFPMFLIGTKISGENQNHGPLGIYDWNYISNEVFGGNSINVLFMALLSLIYMLRPTIAFKTIFSTKDKETFFMTDFFASIFFPILGFFLSAQTKLSSLDMLGTTFVTVGMLLNYLAADVNHQNLEATSAMSAIKTLFQFKTPKELEVVDTQLSSIYQILGIDGLSRVLFDTALARTKRQLWHTSNPMI
jgi:hypothetical protein